MRWLKSFINRTAYLLERSGEGYWLERRPREQGIYFYLFGKTEEILASLLPSREALIQATPKGINPLRLIFFTDQARMAAELRGKGHTAICLDWVPGNQPNRRVAWLLGLSQVQFSMMAPRAVFFSPEFIYAFPRTRKFIAALGRLLRQQLPESAPTLPAFITAEVALNLNGMMELAGKLPRRPPFSENLDLFYYGSPEFFDYARYLQGGPVRRCQCLGWRLRPEPPAPSPGAEPPADDDLEASGYLEITRDRAEISNELEISNSDIGCVNDAGNSYEPEIDAGVDEGEAASIGGIPQKDATLFIWLEQYLASRNLLMRLLESPARRRFTKFLISTPMDRIARNHYAGEKLETSVHTLRFLEKIPARSGLVITDGSAPVLPLLQANVPVAIVRGAARTPAALLRTSYFVGQNRWPVFERIEELCASLERQTLEEFWQPYAGRSCSVERDGSGTFNEGFLEHIYLPLLVKK